MPKPVTAPKRDLPTHAESFNPPEEYLLDDKEKLEYDALDEEDKPTNYLPAKFEALRKVPLYENLIKEHFERCLDLYLCPRLLKKKVNVTDPSKLIPELPSPNDLKPFPTQISIDYIFHTTNVRALALSPNGLYLASGDEDHNVAIWSTRTTKIVRTYKLPNKVIDCIEWCPNTEFCLLSVANEELVHIIAPALYGKEQTSTTESLLSLSKKTYEMELAASDMAKKEQFIRWDFSGLDTKVKGHKMITLHAKHIIARLAWHIKGDYFATMANNV